MMRLTDHEVMWPVGEHDSSFGLREFQLALLDRMHDEAPQRSEAALRWLGATRADAVAAEKRRMGLASDRVLNQVTRWHGWQVETYLAVLGDPMSTEPRDVRQPALQFLRWETPVWPDLWFEVMVLPDGSMFNDQLRRRVGTASPPMESVNDLKPWSCTEHELADRFGPLECVDGWHPCWVAGFTAPDATGQTRRYEAGLGWGLLQCLYKRSEDN
jgi:hypothetical protein